MRAKPMVVPSLMAAALLLVTWSALVAATSHGPRHGTATAGQTKALTCELCGKPISPQSEVTLKGAADGSQHHYRCVHCALLGARDWVKGDLTITARSGGAGVEVHLAG